MKYLFTLFFIVGGIYMMSSQQSFSSDSYEIKFTDCSNCNYNYTDFNSCEAINKIADIENEHRIHFKTGTSRFYGTIWRQNAESIQLETGITQYQSYLKDIQPFVHKPDSLHCTIYAYEGLQAGLTDIQLQRLEKIHKEIWKSRERAGWSIGYILVKHFNWKAYLIIDKSSKEYNHCLKAYKKNKSYPVWKQPDIPLEDFYVIGQNDTLIEELLKQHEFGWGFSEQGIHTWISRYNELKECNWLGAPSKKYQQYATDAPLFISTKFREYQDYYSHVVVFPPK